MLTLVAPGGGLGEQGREGALPWYTDCPAYLGVSCRRDSAEPPPELIAALKQGFGGLVSPLEVPLSTNLLVFTRQMHSRHGTRAPEGPRATQAPSGTSTQAQGCGVWRSPEMFAPLLILVTAWAAYSTPLCDTGQVLCTSQGNYLH